MPSPTIAPGVKLKFFDLTGERWREYTFPGYDTIMITGSLAGARGADGTHFLLTADGHGHEIPSSWIHLEWDSDDPKFRWDEK